MEEQFWTESKETGERNKSHEWEGGVRNKDKSTSSHKQMTITEGEEVRNGSEAIIVVSMGT